MTNDDRAAYDARLQERLKILRDALENGKVYFNQDLQVVESLKNVRYAADGSVDLNTVDGSVRSLALAIEHFNDREKTKNVASLHDIQSTYFEFISRNFSHFFVEMLKHGATPHQIGMAISRNQQSRDSIAKSLPDFMNAVEHFWAGAGPIVHVHLEDMPSALKCVFGGDFFPAHAENLASKCGIYTDTIILPDPFLRTKGIFPSIDMEKKVYYVLKHALNILQYKDLACADLAPPIVAIVPDYTAIDENEKEFMLRLGQEDATRHATNIFGRPFDNFDEVLEFSSKLETVEQVAAEVKAPQRVLFDTNWTGDLLDQLKRARGDLHASIIKNSNPGVIVASQALGRMATSNELLLKARRLNGCPVIDAPTSWQYFAWKLEYDAERSDDTKPSSDLHVVQSLQTLEKQEFKWLGRVPPDALLELRKADALPELRSILSKGVKELVEINPSNFHRTSDQVFDNIHSAFKMHEQQLDKLNEKKWNFAFRDLGKLLATGSVAVVAAATGSAAWGLAAVAADQLIDGKKLKDIPKSIKDLVEEDRRVRKSPVGLLYSYQKFEPR